MGAVMPGEHNEAETQRLLGSLSADIRNIKDDMTDMKRDIKTISTDVEDLKEDKWHARGAVWLGRAILIGITSGGTLLISKAGVILAALAR